MSSYTHALEYGLLITPGSVYPIYGVTVDSTFYSIFWAKATRLFLLCIYIYIFCGESCAIEKDKKHPDGWRRAVLCRTEYASPGKKSFKESILKVCDQRKDNVAEQVRSRVEGALSDLPAADARYHVDCMTNFMSANSIPAAQNASKINVNEDPAFDSVKEEMIEDKSRL